MNDDILFIFLETVYKNSSVSKLTRKGVNFSKIAECTSYAITEGLIIYTEQRMVLTDKGKLLYDNLGVTYKKRNKAEWIEEDKKSKIPKLDKNTIFLPNQNELSF